MCDRLRCEKNGQPIIESCRDCLIPTDGPMPDMFKPASRDYAERCANCKDFNKCTKEDPTVKPNTWCDDWREINAD